MTDTPKDQADSDGLRKKINEEVLAAYLYGWVRRDKGLYARGGYIDEYTDQIMQLFADQQAADRKALLNNAPVKRNAVLTSDGPAVANAYMEGFNVCRKLFIDLINGKQS